MSANWGDNEVQTLIILQAEGEINCSIIKTINDCTLPRCVIVIANKVLPCTYVIQSSRHPRCCVTCNILQASSGSSSLVAI